MGSETRRQPRRGIRPRKPRSDKAKSGRRGSPAESYVLDLQSQAGNRAVASLLAQRERDDAAVQRDKPGWHDADTRGNAWNAGEHDVGTIRRVPIEGLKHGNQTAAVGDESNKTTESAAGKAIVLIPSSVKPGQTVDVMVHLHGWTQRSFDPHAGWRQHSDSGSVRDVDQDRIEAQLQASKQSSLIAVLPQGVGRSKFGGLSVDSYLSEVLAKLSAVGEPPGATSGKPLVQGRLIMSAHSGGGDRIANMLDTATGKGAAELILFEAIHAGGLSSVVAWATNHLDVVASGLARTSDPNARKKIVDSCPKLYGYYSAKRKDVPGSGSYVATYTGLRKALDKWFGDHAGALGADFDAVRARFRVEELQGASHETSVRGLGDDPTAGPLYDALVRLDNPTTPGTLKRSGASTWVPPSAMPKLPKAGVPAGSKAAPTGATATTAETKGSPKSPLPGRNGSLPAVQLGVDRIFEIAWAHGLSPLRLPAAALAIAQGGDSYAVLARTLVVAGLRDVTDLTDALFHVAHPELGGGRIAPGQNDLKAQWLRLRSEYARTAVSAAPKPAADVPGGSDVAGADVVDVPAKDPASPQSPAKADDTSGQPVTKLDPATVKAAKAATGAVRMTDEQKAKARERAAEQARTGGSAQAAADIEAVLRKYGKTADSWFAGLAANATFLDVPIVPSGGNTSGVHSELLGRLQHAEQTLLGQFPGLSKAQIAGKMGINQISGVRPPTAATGATQPSAHCFGLAVDINHPTNPFVGNNKPKKKKNMTDDEKAKYNELLTHRSPRVIERAMLLLRQKKFDIEADFGQPDNAADAAKLWEKHHEASEALAEYLRLAADVNGKQVSDLVTALRASGKDSRSLDEWKTLITEDKSLLKYWDFQHHKAPEKGGYMDLGKELVVALVSAGLLWGGAYRGSKDIMHFDWRGGTIKDRSPS